MNGLNNSFKIAITNIRYFQLTFFLLATLFVGGMIALFGVVALGELAVNTIFGRFAPLLGLVLITPIVIHELNEEISDVVLTKKIAHWHVLGLRLIFSLVLVTAILIGYVAILIMNDSVVSFTRDNRLYGGHSLLLRKLFYTKRAKHVLSI